MKTNKYRLLSSTDLNVFNKEIKGNLKDLLRDLGCSYNMRYRKIAQYGNVTEYRIDNTGIKFAVTTIN